MVKRTVVVLGILSLVIVMAGTSMAQMGMSFAPPCFDACSVVARPMYVPVACCEPIQKTIVKKWECKIVGPCPAPGPACASSGVGREDRVGALMALATAIGTPFDLLGGSYDAVYGCLGGNDGACCGTCPLGFVPSFFGAAGSVGNNFFGGLW
jgi:hypothetical protein